MDRTVYVQSVLTWLKMPVFHANKTIAYSVLTKLNAINAKMDIIYLKLTAINVLNFVDSVRPPQIACNAKKDIFTKVHLKPV